MTYDSTSPVTRRDEWLLALWVTARVLLTVAVLVALYHLVPLDRSVDWEFGVALLFALLLLVVIGTLEVRAILHATRPRLRALEALTTSRPSTC